MRVIFVKRTILDIWQDSENASGRCSVKCVKTLVPTLNTQNEYLVIVHCTLWQNCTTEAVVFWN